MTTIRTVLLLRHAEAEPYASGRPDISRVLTPHGHEQARNVGGHLRDSTLPVDRVWCSSAIRTRQTLEDLGLDDAVEIDFSDALYDAGSDTIRAAIGELDDSVRSVLVVGHAPGIPATAHALAEPRLSEPQALSRIEHRFPPATLARIDVFTPWNRLTSGTLVSVFITA